uniref:homeobox protein Rhox5-like n=1 Tax=Myodes glareolus TaxID=447135 RepID=UPI002022539A|nr:homeobox protein Rhox5-like [Myodes glareolus]
MTLALQRPTPQLIALQNWHTSYWLYAAHRDPVPLGMLERSEIPSQSVEVEQKMDSVQGTKALPAEDGRNEEESGQGQPAWGAIAAEPEREKELNGESHSAAGTSGPVDDDMNKKDGDTRGDQGSEQQPQELIPDRVDGERVPSVPIPDGGERVQSMPRQVPRRRLRHRFTQWQLEELERIFQINGSLGVQARKQLARWMGVSEAVVKRWFQKRREQHSRYMRL